MVKMSGLLDCVDESGDQFHSHNALPLLRKAKGIL